MRRSAQEIEALLTAFTPEEDVRPLLALENIFVDQDFSNKEQAIQFLCGNLGVNGRTEHPFELEEDVWQRKKVSVTTGVGFGEPSAAPILSGSVIPVSALPGWRNRLTGSQKWAKSNW
ncbi:PTS sugar transporter subunit IIA [Escherichia coli]